MSLCHIILVGKVKKQGYVKLLLSGKLLTENALGEYRYQSFIIKLEIRILWGFTRVFSGPMLCNSLSDDLDNRIENLSCL